MRLSHIAIATLSLVLLGHRSSSAETLPDATACELALEKTASQLIFDLSLELQRHNSLSRNEYNRIQNSLQILRDNEISSQAKSCFKSFPMQRLRYQDWIRVHAHKVVGKANDRLEHVCARNTRIFVTTQKLHLDRAVTQNQLARAATLAAHFEKSLRDDPMMSRCRATRPVVRKVLESYLPRIQNMAALPKVKKKVSTAYFSAKTTLDSAHAALDSSPADSKVVPKFYDGAAALRLIQQLEQCQLYAKLLLDLGESGQESVSPNAPEISVNDARTFCQDAQETLPELTRQSIAHNEKLEVTALKRWRRFAFKGWDMERIFNEKGRPPIETQVTGGFLWTYRTKTTTGKTCATYRFSKRGKLLGKAPSPCPNSKVATQ